MKIKVLESSFHRNGICGNGFHAVLFKHRVDGRKAEKFLAILFDEPGSCAVISLDRIERDGVGFARGNSWRGDHFEDELRRQIKEGAGNVGKRIGPFAVG